MNGLAACDICGRQVPTGFGRSKLWRLGWEWSTFVTFGIGTSFGFGVGFMAPKPVSMRTRWVCGACWPWELMLVDSIRISRIDQYGKYHAPMEAPQALRLVKRMRRLSLSLETAQRIFNDSPDPAHLVLMLETSMGLPHETIIGQIVS